MKDDPTRISVSTVWSALPQPVYKALIQGGTGSSRLLRIARATASISASSGKTGLLDWLVTDLILCAWEEAIFDPVAASTLLALDPSAFRLSPDMASFVSECARSRPGNQSFRQKLEDLLLGQDIDQAKTCLDDLRSAEPDNLYWLGFGRNLGIHYGQTEWYGAWLAQIDLPEWPTHYCRAEIDFANGDFAKAATGFDQAYKLCPFPGALIKLGESLFQTGQREAALNQWTTALACRPWQINLLARVTDALNGSDLPSNPPQGPGVILLYSWNHGPDLDTTLASLAGSELGQARLLVLNNGSTDSTSEIVSKWSGIFGERFSCIHLPVNIGAPAARNWLLAESTVKMADWAVFLDDDALVPPDWLGHFGTALRNRPDARIIGCRVVDVQSPMTMQSVDLHFDLLEEPAGSRNSRHPQRLMTSYANEADFGQYAYLRPAASVTGCCHLLTRASLDAVGGFDIRFTPSQFDDFERDLRSALAGELPLYQGHLAVRHKRRNNPGKGVSRWQQANISGNMKTLCESYTRDDISAVSNRDLRALSRDLQSRLKLLESS